VSNPIDFLATDTLRNGTAVTVRHIRPDDRDRLARAFRNLERDTVYTRFFRYIAEPTEEQLRRATLIDPGRGVALVVTTGAGADEVIIAGGRYMLPAVAGEKRAAEIAFLVEEDYQGLGIAGRILRYLAEIARAQGVSRFDAEVLSRNAAMLRVFARSGLPLKQRREGGTVHVELSLEESGR
jgi:RimJ/RimL family protein N-acetyltransferase